MAVGKIILQQDNIIKLVHNSRTWDSEKIKKKKILIGNSRTSLVDPTPTTSELV